MRTIILLVGLLIPFKLYSNDISESVGLIHINGQNYSNTASGLMISYNSKYYFATNAHVCLGEYKAEIYTNYKMNWIKTEQIEENSELNYVIELQNNTIIMSISIKKLIYQPFKDICLIPIDSLSTLKNVYDLKKSNFSFEKQLFVRAVTFNKKRFKNKAKLSKREMIGKLLKTFKPIDNISYYDKGKLRSDLVLELDKVNQYSFKATFGDSGSPVFNNKNELVGLVYSKSGDGNNFGSVIPANEIKILIESSK
jgi:hypothetical protein